MTTKIHNKYILIFLEYQRAFNSAYTYKHYRETLIHFERYIDLNSYNLSNLTLQQYNGYLLYLRTKKLANRTLITYTRAVKTMYKYLYENGYIDNDEYQKFKLIRKKKVVKMPLFTDEIKKIDNSLDLNNYYGLRNYLIIHLMLDNGLRRKEVINLEYKDISEKYISIYDAKGGKDRIIPISQDLYTKIQEFKKNFTFPGLNTRTKIFDLSEYGIATMFRRLRQRTGLNKFNPHLLRHTFATSYIYHGGSVVFLSIILGHEEISTTQQYLHLSNSFKLLDDIDIYKIKYDIK